MGVPEAISGVPGVDMSDLSNRKHEISQQLLQAAEGIGFFYVTGLCVGIVVQLIQVLRSSVTRFPEQYFICRARATTGRN